MTIRARFALLGIILLLSVIGLTVLLRSTISTVQIDGPLYTEIIQAKDLVADSVPPVVNLIEPYLLVLQCLDDTNPDSRAERLAKIAALETAYHERQKFWADHLPAGDLRTLLCEDSRIPAEHFFIAVTEKILPASKANDRITMKKLATGDLRSFYSLHQQAIDQVAAKADVLQNQLERSANQRVSSHLWLTSAIAAGMGAICAAGLFTTIRHIGRSLTEVVTGLNRMISGDLTVQLAERGRDEFTHLTRAVNSLAHELSTLVGMVRERSNLLTGQSVTLASASAGIVAASSTTSQRANDAEAATVRLTAGVDTVSQAATGLDQAAREIASSLQDSSLTIDQASQLAVKADASIMTLDKASADIGSVASEIAAIAAQTNLLALNATIEAASAGEAGRGFAVVAGEVKNLARKTAEATAVVGKRVEAIQSATRTAVGEVREVAAAVKRIEQQQQTIAAAVEEQSHATASISADLRGISREGTGIASAMQATNLAAASANDSAQEINRAAATLGQTAIQLTATVANKTIADGVGAMTSARADTNAQVPATAGANAF